MPDETPNPLHPILRSPFRPLDLRRDALTGPPAEQERHRLARVALLQILFDRMHDFWRGVCRQGHLGTRTAQTIAELEALAAVEGRPGRAALWTAGDHEERDAIVELWAMDVAPLLDLRLQLDRHRVALWAGWTTVGAEAARLAARLQVPLPWLSLELQDAVYPVLTSYVTDRPQALQLERGLPETAVHLRTRPGESQADFLARARIERLRALAAPPAPGPRRRLPKDTGYIRQSVEWLVRRRLDKVFIHQLAREYVANNPALGDDGRKHVRESIARAHAWLNAVPPSADPS